MRFDTKLIKEVIDEISMGPFGSNIKVDSFVQSGVPVLNGRNLYGVTLVEDGFNYVTSEKAMSLKKAVASRGDVVVTHRGTLGQIVYIPSDSLYERYVISQSQFRIQCNKDVMLPEFMVYYFHTREGQHNLLSNSSQVGVPALARATTTFQELEIPVPQIDVQQEIVNMLSSLDARIANNKKINDNLEQQAQALFFERFGCVSIDNLPEGWDACHLGDLVIISNKSFNPVKEPETMLEHYSIPAFDEARFPVFELSTNIKSNKFFVDEDSFLISKLNPTTKRVWKPYCISEKAVCSTEFIVYKAKNAANTEFLYSLIDSELFSAFMCSHVTGSTGSRQRTTPSDTLQFKIVIPPSDEIEEFTAIVRPMYQIIRNNAIENDKLRRLRNSLLPRLMSGELSDTDI